MSPISPSTHTYTHTHTHTLTHTYTHSHIHIHTHIHTHTHTHTHTPQAAKTLRKSGEAGDGELDDDISTDSSEPPQTLLEIDYNTVIDDEDIIDEFALFRNLLEGEVEGNNFVSVDNLATALSGMRMPNTCS